jgi:chromosomal replication initiation ATPase DnaA
MTFDEILSRVATKHGLEMGDMLARSRSLAVTDARSEYFFLALNETPASSVEIGRSIGKDHATVLYGAARHALRHGLAIPRGSSPNRYRRWHNPQLDMIA